MRASSSVNGTPSLRARRRPRVVLPLPLAPAMTIRRDTGRDTGREPSRAAKRFTGFLQVTAKMVPIDDQKPPRLSRGVSSMKRKTLVFATVAAAALVFVSAAWALRFTDESYFTPVGTVGTPYSFTFTGAGGC